MTALLLPTLILTGIAFGASLIPVVAAQGRGLPRWLTPLATGAMVGLCAFGLLPEVMHEGGRLGMLLALGIAVIYSLIHWRSAHSGGHGHHHDHDHGHHGHGTTDHHHHHDHHSQPVAGEVHQHASASLVVLFTSLCVHSLFDGALLFLAHALPDNASVSIVLSLGLHKAFESLSLATILLSRGLGRGRTCLWLLIYALTFPVGVALSAGLSEVATPTVAARFALLATSVAIGNLLGCLVCDFLIPALRRLQRNKTEIYWLAAGVAAAGVLLGGL